MCGSIFRPSRSATRWRRRRQQVEQLREQNRQLRLSEAQLSDPGRIDQIAPGSSVWTRRSRARWCAPTEPARNVPVLAQASTPALPVN